MIKNKLSFSLFLSLPLITDYEMEKGEEKRSLSNQKLWCFENGLLIFAAWTQARFSHDPAIVIKRSLRAHTNPLSLSPRGRLDLCLRVVRSSHRER